jgi:hypothetical protein
LSDSERDLMYRRWCRQQSLDPDAEGAGYKFVESIPGTQTEADEEAGLPLEE